MRESQHQIFFIKSCTELANHLAPHENRLVFSSYGNQVSTELVRWVLLKKKVSGKLPFQLRKWQMRWAEQRHVSRKGRIHKAT